MAVKSKEQSMKKFMLTFGLAAFAVGVFAGDACCDKEKAAAAEKEKAAAQCPAAKEAGATAKKDAESKPAEAPKGEAKKS